MSSPLPTRHPVAVIACLFPWAMWLLIWVLTHLSVHQAGVVLAVWWAAITPVVVFTVHLILWEEYRVDPPYTPFMLMLSASVVVLGVPLLLNSDVGGLMWLVVSPVVMYVIIDKCYKVKPSAQSLLAASAARLDTITANLTNPNVSDLDPELLEYAKHTITSQPKLCIEDIPAGWHCNRMLPHPSLTDEWNHDNAWNVSRTEAPYEGRDRLRSWKGTSPVAAFEAAFKSLPKQAFPLPTDRLANEITTYLVGGGLYNPELADHKAVRKLLIECRAALSN